MKDFDRLEKGRDSSHKAGTSRKKIGKNQDLGKRAKGGLRRSNREKASIYHCEKILRGELKFTRNIPEHQNPT